MGYESRIYIVRKTDTIGWRNPGMRFAEVLMTFNLGRISVDLERWLHKQRPTDCFIYADDGNTEIIDDRCGDPLREIDLIALRQALLLEIERRPDTHTEQLFILARCVLHQLMIYHGYTSDEVVCLHYGY